MRAHGHQEMCTRKPMVALLVITSIRDNPNAPQPKEWVHRLAPIYQS